MVFQTATANTPNRKKRHTNYMPHYFSGAFFQYLVSLFCFLSQSSTPSPAVEAAGTSDEADETAVEADETAVEAAGTAVEADGAAVEAAGAAVEAASIA